MGDIGPRGEKGMIGRQGSIGEQVSKFIPALLYHYYL